MLHQYKTAQGIINYALRRQSRSLNLSISISPTNQITVTAPRFVPQLIINQFLASRADWIWQHLHTNPKVEPRSPIEQRRHFIRHKPFARKIVNNRLEYFNQHYHFRYHKITIRDQSSRWGSCNKHGDLSFNYRIALLPAELSDLIIVHELCHLKEMNHSHRFWALVRQTIPQYLTRRRMLDKIDMNSL